MTQDDKPMTIKDVRDSFVGEHPLVAVIRNALHELQTGDTVSRAYRATQVLEDALAEVADE